MAADLFQITGRRKAIAFLLSGLDDFDLAPAGRIGVETLVASPDWTLYALDPARGKALLIEMPNGTDLSASAFIYRDQYDHGLRAAVLDLDRLVASSAAIKPPENLSFLFSIGRCGSTLASRIFAQLPGVWSLSEPDAFGNIAMARLTRPRSELVELVRATTRWTCRLPEGRDASSIILKPRSEVTLIAELCQEAFPQSRNVFMYRDLASWVNSASRFEQRIAGSDLVTSDAEYWRELWDILMVGTPVSVLDDCFAPNHGPIIGPEFHTLLWDLRIDAYLRALRRGMKFTAIHYTDLNRNRAAETARLLKGCGLSLDHLDLALRGFAEDSHKGSISGNETPTVPLSADRLARATALLARLGKRDYVDARLPDQGAGQESGA